MIDVSKIPVRAFNKAATTRLISTAFIDEPALEPLADDENELEVLSALEGMTSSRLGSPEFIPDGVSPDELVNESHGYGWTFINAAFCYVREGGNRFSGPDRGAWYASWAVDRVATAQAEVAWHLTQELKATGVFENTTAYRELIAAFATTFHDLTEYQGEDFLDPDPQIGYPVGQELASRLLSIGSNGLLFPSVRRQGGTCLAAFRPSQIQNVRQGDKWVFTWAGSPDPRIDKST